MSANSRLPEILQRNEPEIVAEWVRQQLASASRGSQLLKESEVRDESRQFVSLLRNATQSGSTDLNAPAWEGMREFLADLSRSRARQGFTPSDTANFIFSLKLPLFARMRQEYASDPATLAAETWTVSTLLDALGLLAIEAYQKGREEIIARQQQELMELSTPVVKLWEGVLALPLIGTLDSARTQVVMESLLQEIVESGASIAIIDITGVPTVDTLVAQHLLKTVAAARLMGADCIISGIRPQIAQTIVHLGVVMGDVVSKATLADAFRMALRKVGLTIRQAHAPRAEGPAK